MTSNNATLILVNLFSNAACTKVVPSEDGEGGMNQSQQVVSDPQSTFSASFSRHEARIDKLSDMKGRHGSTPDLLMSAQSRKIHSGWCV